jgi:hypothetical protein
MEEARPNRFHEVPVLVELPVRTVPVLRLSHRRAYSPEKSCSVIQKDFATLSAKRGHGIQFARSLRGREAKATNIKRACVQSPRQ